MSIATTQPLRERKSRTTGAVTQLCSAFGKRRVRVNSEYHLSILPQYEGGRPHDVWLPRNRPIKYRLAGDRRTRHAKQLNVVIEEIQAVESGQIKTDLTEAREARDLSSLIADSQSQLPADVSEAVFVDAGWKDGIAQIGFVRLKRVEHGIDVSAASWPERCRTVNDAELSAIEHGASFAPHAVIYSDCKNLVDSLADAYGGWLRWLPRGKNKAVDKIANRRGA